MATDPFSGLGLASNIISLVDFSWKLFSGAKTIYHSATGASEENAALQVIAQDVSQLSNAISVRHAHSEQLRSLAVESHNLAAELLDVLDKLKAKGPNSKWTSFKVALREVWTRDEVQSLGRRISELQSQITAHIQYLIGNRMSDISVALRTLIDTNRQLRLDVGRVASMEKSMKEILRATQAFEANAVNQRPYLLDVPSATSSSDNVQSLSTALVDLGSRGSSVASQQALLRSLYFDLIQSRHWRIENAHINTYTWIFRDSLPNQSKPITFVNWLESENGLFWIQGKPGSGKSTLMKFICGHERTQHHLLVWAKKRVGSEIANSSGTIKGSVEEVAHGANGASKLVQAKYFVWNSGSELQKSQEGLLRSLLFNVLQQCPELIDDVIAQHAKCDLMSDGIVPVSQWPCTWSPEELMAILQDVISASTSIKFCFFIDGLDEFQEESHHTLCSLVEMLKLISSYPNVKLCVSSRPWTVFLDAIESCQGNSLRLEDLTREDIRKFVSDKFEGHDQYQRLSSNDPAYAGLIEEVVRRARGVFLWVHLVVRTLLEGLTYNDTVQIMKRRLEQFPEDLEDFFQHMIDSIPNVYRQQATRTFTVALAASQPLFLMMFSFMDDIESDPQFCAKIPESPLTLEEVAARHEAMRRQLEGRSKGLLEVTYNANQRNLYFKPTVVFLHRTVRDFFKSSLKVYSLMMCGSESRSSPWLLMCRAILAVIRYGDFKPPFRGTGKYEEENSIMTLNFLLRDFVVYARNALGDPERRNDVLRLFLEVQRARDALYQNSAPRKDENHPLHFACRSGVLYFLEQSDLSSSPLIHGKAFCRPLLRSAIDATHTRELSMRPQVVEYLLKQGADPNQVWEDISHFAFFIERIDSALLPTSHPAIYEILESLIAHGANLDVSVSTEANRGTARDYISHCLQAEQAQRLLNIAPSKSVNGIPVSEVSSTIQAKRLSYRDKCIALLRRTRKLGLVGGHSQDVPK